MCVEPFCETTLTDDEASCPRCGRPVDLSAVIAAKAADDELADRVRARRLSPAGVRERRARAVAGMAAYSRQLEQYGR